MVSTDYYLIVSAVLFTIGVLGVLVRRNAIVMFMSLGSHRRAIEVGNPVQLRGEKLQRIPPRKLRCGDTHRGYRSVRPLESAFSETVDVSRVGLFKRSMDVLVVSLERITPVRLWIGAFPFPDLVRVHPNTILLDPTRKALQALAVVILAHPRTVVVVPPVDTANQAATFDASVGEERPPVQTPAVQDRHVVVVSNDHEIDVTHERMGRLAVYERIPIGDSDLVHRNSLPVTASVRRENAYGRRNGSPIVP